MRTFGHLCLGFSANNATSGSGGGVTPELYSSLGTAQGTVLTVSPGATLYRNGLAVSAPYTTDADDALAVFWAADAHDTPASRSDSITIESNASAAPTYSRMRVRAMTPNSGTYPVNVDLSGVQWKKPDGTVITFSLSDVSQTLENGAAFHSSDLTDLIDAENDWNYVRWQLLAAGDRFSTIYNLLTATGSVQQMDGGSFCFRAYGGDDAHGVGDMELYGDTSSDGTGSWTLIATYTGPWDYALGAWQPVHTIGAASRSLTAAWNPDDNIVTLDLSGFTGTPQVYVRRRVLDDYPLALTPYTDWTDVADGEELDASEAGPWEIPYRDSDAPDEVFITASLIPVFGTRNQAMGFTVGEPYGRPYYAIDFEMFRDQLAYQHHITYVGGPLNNIEQQGFDGVVQGPTGELLSWPTGGVTDVIIGLSWTQFGQNLGVHELVVKNASGVVCTAANRGTLWQLFGSNMPSSGSVGPNGGVLLDFTDADTGGFLLIFYDDIAPSLPMTQMTMRRADDDDATKELTAGFQADIDRAAMLRLGNFLIDGTHWSFAPSTPKRADMVAWQAQVEAVDFSNRRQKGSVVDFMCEAGHTPYLNLSPLLPSDYLTAWGAHFAANTVNPSIDKVAFTLGYEWPWNKFTNDYQRNMSVLLWLAAQWGLLGATPDYVTRTVTVNATNSATITENFVTGDLLFCYLSDESEYGPSVYRKKTNTTGTTTLPTGAPAGSASNTDWERIADLGTTGENGWMGVMRAAARELARMWTALKAGLGPNIDPYVIFEGWALGVENDNYESADPTLNPLRAFYFTPLEYAGGPALVDVIGYRTGIWPAPYPPAWWTHADIIGAGWDGTEAGLVSLVDDQLDIDIVSGQLFKTHHFRTIMANLFTETRTVDGVSVRGDLSRLINGCYEHNTAVNSDNTTDQEIIESMNTSAAFEPVFDKFLTDVNSQGGYNLLLGQTGYHFHNSGNFNLNRTTPVQPGARGKTKAFDDYLVAHPNNEFA